MDHVDLTKAALDALQPSPPSATATQNLEYAHCLRGRIVGVLIRRGRLSAQRSLEDCAAFLRVDVERIEAWELGDSAPGLPQLEALTQFLLAAADGASIDAAQIDSADNAEYCLIRQRMIGAKLKLARQVDGVAVEDLGRQSGLDGDLIARYEMGEIMIPVNHLCALARAVNRDLEYFAHLHSVEQVQLPSQSAAAQHAAANSDLVRFATDDRNQAFIRLAMAFRQIDRQALHRIAEALYTIINERRDANGRSPAPQ